MSRLDAPFFFKINTKGAKLSTLSPLALVIHYAIRKFPAPRGYKNIRPVLYLSL